jgi:hypothetical protein
MKSKLAGVGASKAVMGASLALLLCGLGTSARADAIPYPLWEPLILPDTLLRPPRTVTSSHISPAAPPVSTFG